jgi:RNA polymerase sigma-70 factor, ECF subfamily
MELPEAQTSVVYLTCVEGYSYKDAAEHLGVPIGTVMSRLASARAKLTSSVGRSRPGN